MVSQEHPLLKLWKQCDENIGSAIKNHRLIRCIPVFAGVFIEELEAALNETTKKFCDHVKQLGGRSALPFSPVLPGEWVNWFVDYRICQQDKNKDEKNRIKNLCDVKNRERKARGLTEHSAIQRLFKYRNTAAHFNLYPWKEHRRALEEEWRLLGEFCRNLVGADSPFSEELRTSLMTHEKSNIYCLNAITLGRLFLNTLSCTQIHDQRREYCFQSLLDTLVEQYSFEKQGNMLEDQLQFYFRTFHKEYGHSEANQKIYQGKIDDIRRIMENSFDCSFQDKELENIRNSFRGRLEILTKKEEHSQEGDVDIYHVRVGSGEEAIMFRNLSRMHVKEGTWEKITYPVDGKEYLPSDFVSCIKKEIKVLVKKYGLPRPDKKKTILLLECDAVSHDTLPYQAMAPWGRLKSKDQTLYSQFQSIITMVQDDDFQEYRPEEFPDEFQLEQNIVLVSCREDLSCFWNDASLHGALITGQDSLCMDLTQKYEINKHFVCVVPVEYLEKIKKKLTTTMSITEIFHVCSDVNKRLQHADEYVSCIVSYANWDQEGQLVSDMSTRS